MQYKVNVFENNEDPRDLRFILTKPEVITRVMKGYNRKIRSFIGDVTPKKLAEWRELATVEIKR